MQLAETRLFNPTLKALRDLGGTAPKGTILKELKERGGFAQEILAEPPPDGRKGYASNFDLRFDWTLTGLMFGGYLDNCNTRPELIRGTWALTKKALEKDRNLSDDEKMEVVKQSHKRFREERGTEETADIAQLVDAFDPDFAHKTEADIVAEFYHRFRTELPQAKIRLNVRTPNGKYLDILVQLDERLVAIEAKADDNDTEALAEQIKRYMDSTGVLCLALCGVDDIPVVMAQLKHLLALVDSNG